MQNSLLTSKTIYLLPNAVTTASLFWGFLSIIQSSKGQYEQAIISIILAAVFDALDGKVARLMKTQSFFGEIYDSLSDMVSFGVAPAMMAYFWCLNEYDKIGSAAVFIYVAGAAMRLARFTAKADDGKMFYFLGLPSPAAALCVVSYIWVLTEYSLDSVAWLRSAMLPLIVLIGIIMVSNVRYFSFKRLPVIKRGSFFFWATVLLVIGASTLVAPVLMLFLVFWSYLFFFVVFNGLRYIFHLRRKKRVGEQATLVTSTRRNRTKKRKSP